MPDGVVSAGLGSLHHRHPLVVVAEQGEVQVGTTRVGLGADGQLGQQPLHSLRVAAKLGVDDGLFEALLDLACVHVGRRRAGELGFTVQGGVTEKITEVLKEVQKSVRRVLVDGDDLGGDHVVDDKEGRLGVGVRDAQGDHVLTGVLDEEVVLVQKLHLPHAEVLELGEVLVELEQGPASALFLTFMHRSVVEVNKKAML